MELLWIVLGAVYVIYRFFKGKDFEHGFGCLAAIAMFVIAGLTESLLVGALVILIVSIVGLAMVFSSNNKEREKFVREYSKKIPQKYIDKVKNTPGSPYGRDDVNSAACYVWLCREETNRLQHLPSKEFDEILGMPLADIPLDPEHPTDYRRRKNVAIEIILQRDGLVFQEPDYRSLPIKSKLVYHDRYYYLVTKFLTQQGVDTSHYECVAKERKEVLQDITKNFENHGYYVRANEIPPLITASESPYNSGELSVEKWYTWLCRQKTEALLLAEDSEISKELGVDITSIILGENEGKQTEEWRKILCVEYILRRNGLRYIPPKKKRYLLSSVNQSYRTEFSKYMNLLFSLEDDNPPN